MNPIDRKQNIDPHFPAVILDIKGLITSSYHSGTDPHPCRDEKTGERCNSAGHGAANFLERVLLPILENNAPINIIAVMDGGNDLRRGVFPTYKQKRQERKKEENETIGKQLALLTENIHGLLLALGCTMVKCDHREADDVIAGLVRALGDRPTTIYTVDHDLLQLVNDTMNTWVVLFDTPAFFMTYKYSDASGSQYIEVEPDLVALFKSLIGDSSDEYGGVPGFGPAKWNELTDVIGIEGLRSLRDMVASNDFTELRETVAAHPQIKPLSLLLTNINTWRIMYYLANLHPEACWGAIGKKLIKPTWHKRVPTRAAALKRMTALGIDDMINHFEKWFVTYHLADEAGLEKALDLCNDHLEDSPVTGFDYESYDSLKHDPFQQAVRKRRGDYVDVMSQIPTGASFCFGANLQHSIYMPVAHKGSNVSDEYIPAIIEECRGMNIPLVVQNAGFEMNLTERVFAGQCKIFKPHDTRVMASYYDENLMGMGKDGLKDLSWDHLRYRQTEYKELLEMHEADDMRDLTGEQTLAYGCDDSIVACHLWVVFRWALLLEDQWEFYLTRHTAPAHIMEGSFRKGVNIDWAERDRLAAADDIVITEGNKTIRALLEKHCQEPNEKAVEAFINSDLDALHYTLSEKWKKKNDGKAPGKERMDALIAEVKMKALEGSVYVPYEEIKREYAFIGSAAQLRDISAHLEFSVIIEKDSAKYLNEWLTNWADAKLTTAQDEFVARLALAVGKPLKGREGPEFDDLKEFCVEVMQPTMKSDWVGDELNYDSPTQMQHLFYCKLGLPVRRRSKVQKDTFRYERGYDGSPATSKKAIDAALAEDCPSDDWRRLLLTTMRDVKGAMTRFELFYTPYPLWQHPVDGCVHPGVKDPGTVTRRPTSGSPNILQVSKGPTRKMFIPHDDGDRVGPFEKLLNGIAATVRKDEPVEAPTIWLPRLPKRLIMAPDFSGQELRITGSEAKDPVLIKAYTGGKRYVDKYGIERLEVTDIHSLTTVMFVHRYVARQLGEEALNYLPLDGKTGRVPYEWYQQIRGMKLDKEMEAIADLLVDDIDEPTLTKLYKSLTECRNKAAKPTNFLITYLGTASTLAENTSMPEEFCEVIMKEVFDSFARLSPWQNEMIQFAKANGYTTTAYGTRKHLTDDILSSDRSLRSRAERQAVNQIIQGGAADILHTVETEIYEQEVLERFNSWFLAPVYDEIVLDVPLNDNLPEMVTELAGIMDLTPPGHAIPMMAEFSFGPNWADQYELGERPCEQQIEEALSAMFTPKKEKAHAA